MTYEGSNYNPYQHDDGQRRVVPCEGDTCPLCVWGGTVDHSEDLTAAEKRRDNLSDLVLCICLVLVGILVGWRLNHLTHDYKAELPRCAEDEWISPQTFECVHVDVIVNGALDEQGMIEVPR